MGFWEAYAAVVLGVLISFALPALKRLLPKYQVAEGWWDTVKPFAIVAAFSLVTGLLVVSFVDQALETFGQAVVAGYAWDSTVQKIGT